MGMLRGSGLLGRAAALAAVPCGLALWAPAAASERLPPPGVAGAPAWFAPQPAGGKLPGSRPVPGLLQRTIATEYGVGVISTQVGRDAADNATFTRFDTTWIARTRGETLRLGDSVNRVETWGRPVRFGGIQYGSNLGAAPRPDTPAPSAALLKRGSTDRAFAAGFLRRGYGMDDDRYGAPFGSAMVRRGILDDLTVEVRGSARREVGNGGVALQLRVDRLGVITGATAASRSDAGFGRLARTSFEHRSNGFGLAVGSQWTSVGYRQLGMDDEAIAPRVWTSARATYGSPRDPGAFAIAYSALARYGEALTRSVQGTYRLAAGRVHSLTLSFAQTIAPEPDTAVMLTFSFPLDRAGGRAGAQRADANAMWILDRAPAPLALAHQPSGN